MKIFYNIKKFITNDFIDIVISIVLSTFLEFGRLSLQHTLFYNKTNDTKQIEFSSLKNVVDISMWDSVVTIVLLTLIIWGVTAIAKMMEKNNSGKKRKFHTLFMLMSFIISSFWYIVKVFFIISNTTIMVTVILCAILLITIVSYLVNNEKNGKYKTDFRIA